MPLYVVSREAGPAWIDGTSAFEQPAVDAHVTFMADLEQAGMILFAGPLNGTEHGRIRVLLVAEATGDAEIRRALARDPWERADRIITDRIEPWALLVGAGRLSAGLPSTG
jgi:uncharacterized protein YciI